jgi:hypothetical protein
MSDEQDPKADEQHPLSAAREAGARIFPTWQTGSVDTSSGALVDLKSVSPVFEQTRQALVKHAADVFDPDTDTADENVILPDDEAEADAVKAQTVQEAASLPEQSFFGGDAPADPAKDDVAQEPAQDPEVPPEDVKPENG